MVIESTLKILEMINGVEMSTEVYMRVTVCADGEWSPYVLQHLANVYTYAIRIEDYLFKQYKVCVYFYYGTDYLTIYFEECEFEEHADYCKLVLKPSNHTLKPWTNPEFHIKASKACLCFELPQTPELQCGDNYMAIAPKGLIRYEARNLKVEFDWDKGKNLMVFGLEPCMFDLKDLFYEIGSFLLGKKVIYS